MAGELRAQFLTGNTLYAILLNMSGDVWNGSAFDDTPTSGEWAGYDIPLAEDGVSGYYRGNLPALAAGVYEIRVHRQAGGLPLATDPLVWTDQIAWSGTAIVVPAGTLAIADQVWDELMSGHAIAGSAAAALTAAGSAADPMLSTPGDYASGTLGYYIGRLAGGRVTVQATTTPTGEIPEIVAGADYLAEDGRAFEWTDAEEAWPDLTGATITFCARTPGGVTVEHSGTVVTPTGEKVVQVELTDIQTAYLASIKPGGWSWCTWAELADGNLIPLIRGSTPVLVVVGPPEA